MYIYNIYIIMKLLDYICRYQEFSNVTDIKIIDVKYVLMGPCIPANIIKDGFKYNGDDFALVQSDQNKK